MTLAFLSLLIESRGVVVNNVSLLAFAPLPLVLAYSILKAAAFNMTQSLRALLAPRGVTVHAALTGPTNTDMTRGLGIPKAAPESIARAIFDGVESGEEEIFPDPMSALMADSWRNGAAKAMERENAAFVAAEPGATSIRYMIDSNLHRVPSVAMPRGVSLFTFMPSAGSPVPAAAPAGPAQPRRRILVVAVQGMSGKDLGVATRPGLSAARQARVGLRAPWIQIQDWLPRGAINRSGDPGAGHDHALSPRDGDPRAGSRQ